MTTTVHIADIRRAEKVARLIEYIDEQAEARGLQPQADAEAIARWLRGLTPAQWLGLAQSAGYKSRKAPSATTQNLVIDTYARRVDFAGEARS